MGSITFRADGLDRKIKDIAEEEERTLAPNFWDDAKKAEEILRKIKQNYISNELL